jgi:membrane carboxypeptidase/penicillin-binding protein
MNISLYELTSQYRRDLEHIQNSDLDEQQATELLETMQGAIQDKATNVAMVIRNMETTAEAIKAAETEMAARRKSIERKMDWMKTYLLQNMEATGISKIESPYFVIALRDNPESLIVEPDAAIPPEYWKPQDPVLDKAGLKKDIQLGLIVDGCRLERKKSVRIK